MGVELRHAENASEASATGASNGRSGKRKRKIRADELVEAKVSYEAPKGNPGDYQDAHMCGVSLVEDAPPGEEGSLPPTAVAVVAKM